MIVQSCNTSYQQEFKILHLDNNFDSTDFSLKISSDTNVYVLGQIPNIKVQLLNNSNRQVTFFTMLDGSSDSMRYPYAGFRIYTNDSIVKPSLRMRCGNMDGISKECIILLNPGESIDPHMDAPWIYRDHIFRDSTIFAKRGNYRIKYYYSTKQDTLSEWLGSNVYFELYRPESNFDSLTQNYMNLFSKVPSIALTSEPIEIEIL